MRVRSIDNTNDWKFGRGRNDYKKDIDAVAQSIKTRLQSFVGDCFFDLKAGVDWFEYLGTKKQEELKIAITTVLLNTENVVSANEVLISVGTSRIFLIQYDVNTIYGKLIQQIEQGF